MPTLDPDNVVFEATNKTNTPTNYTDYTDFTLGQGDLTIEAWINLTSTPDSNSHVTIGTQRYYEDPTYEGKDILNSSLNPPWEVFISSSSGNLKFQTELRGTLRAPSAADDFQLDTWYHVTLMRWEDTDTTKYTSLYVDGEETVRYTTTTTRRDIPRSTAPITVGGYRWTEDTFYTDYNFPGEIQDFRIITQAKYDGDGFTPTARTATFTGSVYGDPHIVSFEGERYTL